MEPFYCARRERSVEASYERLRVHAFANEKCLEKPHFRIHHAAAERFGKYLPERLGGW